MQDPSPASPISRPTPISKFLLDLTVRPNDPPYVIDEQNYRDSTSGAALTASASSGMLGMSTAQSSTSLAGMLSGAAAPPQNPEADSFSYIETLLEALAVLGRLGSALDAVAQKVPQEIYSLVESTLDEVEERAEFGRRSSVISTGGGRLDSSLLLTGPGAASRMAMGTGIPGVSVIPGAVRPLLGPLANRGPPLRATVLRLAALETSTKVTDQETLRDFFWTLFSKLDAVTQGLRVVYEVSNRIGSVRQSGPAYVNEAYCSCRDDTSMTLQERNLALCSLWPKCGCQSKPRSVQARWSKSCLTAYAYMPGENLDRRLCHRRGARYNFREEPHLLDQ